MKVKNKNMSYKAYIDNIQAKTGKGPEYYLSEAKKKGLKTAQIMSQLNT